MHTASVKSRSDSTCEQVAIGIIRQKQFARCLGPLSSNVTFSINKLLYNELGNSAYRLF